MYQNSIRGSQQHNILYRALGVFYPSGLIVPPAMPQAGPDSITDIFEPLANELTSSRDNKQAVPD
jgi:hypothetical protein